MACQCRLDCFCPSVSAFWLVILRISRIFCCFSQAFLLPALNHPTASPTFNVDAEQVVTHFNKAVKKLYTSGSRRSNTRWSESGVTPYFLALYRRDIHRHCLWATELAGVGYPFFECRFLDVVTFTNNSPTRLPGVKSTSFLYCGKRWAQAGTLLRRQRNPTGRHNPVDKSIRAAFVAK